MEGNFFKLKNIKFQMLFIGKGWNKGSGKKNSLPPNKSIVTRITGPGIKKKLCINKGTKN